MTIGLLGRIAMCGGLLLGSSNLQSYEVSHKQMSVETALAITAEFIKRKFRGISYNPYLFDIIDGNADAEEFRKICKINCRERYLEFFEYTNLALILNTVPESNRHGLELVSAGNGFFITQNGYLLTNYHVVEKTPFKDTQTLYARDMGSMMHEMDIVAYNKFYDVALLKTRTLPSVEIIPPSLEDMVHTDERLFSIGYDVNAEILEEELERGINNVSDNGAKVIFRTYTPIEISELTIHEQGNSKMIIPESLLVKCAANKGNSGSQVLTDFGRLGGIVMAKDDDNSNFVEQSFLRWFLGTFELHIERDLKKERLGD